MPLNPTPLNQSKAVAAYCNTAEVERHLCCRIQNWKVKIKHPYFSTFDFVLLSEVEHTSRERLDSSQELLSMHHKAAWKRLNLLKAALVYLTQFSHHSCSCLSHDQSHCYKLAEAQSKHIMSRGVQSMLWNSSTILRFTVHLVEAFDQSYLQEV